MTILRHEHEVNARTGQVRWQHPPACAEPISPGDDAVLRVVALGGGTGLPAVLRGLRPHAVAAAGGGPGVELTAVVTMADDGGSSGELRRQLGVLPPGDVRHCLLALADEAAPLAVLLAHRFVARGGLGGHALGNLFLAASSQLRRDFVEAIAVVGALLGTAGRVLPCTQDPVELEAEFEDGSVVRGESRIPARGRRIRRVRLVPSEVRALPAVLGALAAADLIVVGPGSLYTSLLPVLLVPGLAEAMRASGACRVLVANLMTQPGETDGHDVADHLAGFEAHLGPGLFHAVLVNTAPLAEERLARYGAEGAYPVTLDPARVGPHGPACLTEHLVADGDLVRHDPDRLARALLALVGMGKQFA